MGKRVSWDTGLSVPTPGKYQAKQDEAHRQSPEAMVKHLSDKSNGLKLPGVSRSKIGYDSHFHRLPIILGLGLTGKGPAGEDSRKRACHPGSENGDEER